eukprot:TRINITY_DN28771_c0_g1_i1.p1 TRINITY_DN28771_c0_g1~~TRINITY_DN28771_c0_g1_i1.p1  ORF type:complete len:451 (-),score=45.60 TRINITY_DN28771_c0_g1_i1:304-1656(-)
MFQPAGVRTLLDIRYSASLDNLQLSPNTKPHSPSRPFSAPAARNTEPPVGDDDLFVSAVIAANNTSFCYDEVKEGLSLMLESRRDPLLSATTQENTPFILAEATSKLQDLQTTWMKERRTQLRQLTKQLEQEFGFVSPSLDQLLKELMIGEFRDVASIPGAAADRLAVSVSASSSDKVWDVAQSAVDVFVASSDAGLEGYCDATISAAAQQLEKSKQFRANFSKSRQLSLQSNAYQICSQSPIQGRFADERRLRILRSDIEKLKEQQVAEETSISDQVMLPVLQLREISEFVELKRWVDGFLLLAEDCKGHRSPTYTSSTVSSARSSILTPCARGSPSRKSMARLAEARAMDWASTTKQKGSLCRPSTIADKHFGRNANMMSPNSVKSSSIKAIVDCTASSSPVAERSVDVSSRRCDRHDAVVKQHIDNILNELDQIDRVYDGVRRLARF